MSSILKSALVAAAAIGAISISTAAQASTMFSSLSAWETAMGSWAETTSYGAPDGSAISGFTTTDGVAVTVNTVLHSIGNGWATWSGSYTGQVMADYHSTSVAFGVGSVRGFGLFFEPDPFNVINITLNTSDGSTLTQAVNGDHGAAFFGWTGPGVTGFTVNSPADFAAGDVFSGGVPEPATWAMMLVGFGGIGAVVRASRRRQALATA